jgi:SAM-dependent methyltransferase
MKPFAESSEQNKDVILDVIKPLLVNSRQILEIGSGTGQHAVHFARAMPYLQWYPSDRLESLPGIQMWLDDACLDNIQSPIVLDVMQTDWPELEVDAVFTANTLHIMHWNEIQSMFEKVSPLIRRGGLLLIYGPFNYHGQYTSDSNRQFDGWLKSRDPDSGIRDFDHVNELALKNSLQIMTDFEMPANNRILCWYKI